jgi:intein/homing endonuclease
MLSISVSVMPVIASYSLSVKDSGCLVKTMFVSYVNDCLLLTKRKKEKKKKKKKREKRTLDVEILIHQTQQRYEFGLLKKVDEEIVNVTAHADSKFVLAKAFGKVVFFEMLFCCDCSETIYIITMQILVFLNVSFHKLMCYSYSHKLLCNERDKKRQNKVNVTDHLQNIHVQ